MAIALAASLILAPPARTTSPAPPEEPAAPRTEPVASGSAGSERPAGVAAADEPAPEPETHRDGSTQTSSADASSSAGPAFVPYPAFPTSWRPSVVGIEDPDFALDVRCYAVWVLSRVGGERQWTGIHCGVDINAWQGIIALNGGHFGGIRWRRGADYQDAKRVWLAECGKHKVTGPPKTYWWPPKPPPHC